MDLLKRQNFARLLFGLLITGVLLIVLAGFIPVRIIRPADQSPMGSFTGSEGGNLGQEVESVLGWILFETNRGEAPYYMIKPDGSAYKPLSDSGLYDLLLLRESFSEDGSKQVYVKQGLSGSSLILRYLDVSWDSTLVTSEASIEHPVWSPLGSEIAYVLQMEDYSELRIYNQESRADRVVLGSEERQIYHPSWSDDGKHLVFSALNDDKRSELWVVNIADSQTQLISLLDFDDRSPVWVKKISSQEITPTPGGAEDLGTLLNLSDCGQDGELKLDFLVWDRSYGASPVSHVTLTVNGILIYDSDISENTWISESISLAVMQSAEDSQTVFLELKAWNQGVYAEQPKTVQESVTCTTAGVLPAQLQPYVKTEESAQDAENQAVIATPIPLVGFINKILFHSDRDGVDSLYMMNPDGSGQIRVEEDLAAAFQYSGSDQNRIYSPDENLIVFSQRLEIYQTLFVYDISGGWVWQLTDGTHNDYLPAWSPDGEWIVYATERTAESDIALIDPVGRTLKYLVKGDGYSNMHPDWSGDGSQIVFWSDRQEGQRQIYRINLDGSDLQNLSQNQYNDWNPIWVHEPVPLPTLPPVEE